MFMSFLKFFSPFFHQAVIKLCAKCKYKQLREQSPKCVHTVSKLGDNPSKYVLELGQYCTDQQAINEIRNFIT